MTFTILAFGAAILLIFISPKLTTTAAKARESYAHRQVCFFNRTAFSAVPGQVGYLTSLYFPSEYSGNIDCSWTINSTSGYVVKATVLNVSNLFTIVMYDGTSKASRSLGWVSRKLPQTPYYSSGQSMHISLFAHDLRPNSSFNLTYEAVDQLSAPTTMCSSNATTLSAVPGQVGYLTCPYYPFAFNGFIDCSWVIISTSGYVVKATLLNFTSPDSFLRIRIYDGTSDTSRLLGKIFSMTSQTMYYSSGQSMYIRFFTYSLSPNSSFNLTYEAVDQVSAPTSMCSSNGTTLSAEVGQVGDLALPYYPVAFYGFIDCLWTINSTSGYVVKTTLFNITNPAFYMLMVIYDGVSKSSHLLALFSSLLSQTVYYSSGQSMYIRLTTYGLGPNSSFSLTYEAVDQVSAGPSVCSVNAPTLNVVPGQVGYLTSPNYPSPYYNIADCRWLIDAGSGYVVKVTVFNVSLESGYDYLELYNGTQISNTSLIAWTSSMSSPTVFYSSGQYMYIRFYSDNIITFLGFMLKYEAVDQESVSMSGQCVFTSSGLLMWNRKAYPNNFCRLCGIPWLIGYVLLSTIVSRLAFPSFCLMFSVIL